MPEPPVAFARMNPAALEAATALIVPTKEAPGGISTGHALRYSHYDGKLETFQPGLTGWEGRVHPLTVRPAECPNLDTIRNSPDTVWVVVGSGARHLVLAPAPDPEPRSDEQ